MTYFKKDISLCLLVISKSSYAKEEKIDDSKEEREGSKRVVKE